MPRNERQTCKELIEPALAAVGWSWHEQLRIGPGRVNITGEAMYDETQSIIADSYKTAVGIMARVLAETPSAKVRSGLRRLLRIPRLLWRGDELVVEIPAGDSQEWNVAVDGRGYTYRGEITAETVPCMPGHSVTHLPRTVTVTSDDFQREYLLWEDEADNRFLIFNADGQWLEASALGVNPVSLSPGNYSMLFRFEPSSVDQESQLRP